jgi:nitroimidazol reductase NimA-like FMN-containing flavoprotein (pyridoxamine 5'-phosphate oxidase superfamily)
VAEPDVLTYGACRDLLGAGVFGRFAVAGAEPGDSPEILPVNYAVVGESIVIATAVGSRVARAVGHAVAFEVDHVDYARHRGWSVVAAGPAEEVTDPDEIARIRRTWEPRPWASGPRPVLVRIRWTRLSGRRLGQDWTWDELTPVRRTVRS